MAFDGLIRAWSDERTSYRDAAFAIVDKPAGVACDARVPVELGAPTPLLERLRAHGFEPVRVVSSVPERASGATLVAFGDAPSVPSAVRLPAPIDRLTCVVAVDDWRLPASGALPIPEHPDVAPLAYRALRRSGPRALVELTCGVPPALVIETLRKHGHSIVGDDLPNAAVATRLMLHVRQLSGRVSGNAPLPAEFDSWLVGQSELAPTRFAEALARAGVSRHGLAPAFGAFRLLGEEAGEISGVSVERYADHAVLYLSSEEAARHELEMADCLMDQGAAGVYVKRRVRADLRGVDAASLAPPLPLRGVPAPDPIELVQGRLRFLVRLADGLATGLFLDQRANWARVLERAADTSLLNLFCYTGAFTVAAAAGGAAATTSVDLAGRALSRLGENLTLNGLSGPQHRLLKSDVPAWLARAQRTQRRFDTVVLDPPSFGTRGRGVLSTRRDNPDLLEAALGVLAPGGRLLCVSHHRKISDRELGEQLARACERRGLQARCQSLSGGWDCPTLPGVTGTKSMLAQLSP
jgi:23S rRNA (cytosine1962-C5)-methyltransferase